MKMFMKKLTVPALIVMLATAIPTSCKKNEVLVPPVELEDQIMYNENEPVEIRSAIYEAEENGMTTFYLSPTQGISDVKRYIRCEWNDSGKRLSDDISFQRGR